jgi:hypothetical protein
MYSTLNKRIFKIIVFDFPQKLKILIFFTKMSQHVTGFPWKYLKIFQFGIAWHVTAFHLKPFFVTVWEWLVSACHGRSQDVT